jgi:small-conductance mechanosensitive channel
MAPRSLLFAAVILAAGLAGPAAAQTSTNQPAATDPFAAAVAAAAKDARITEEPATLVYANRPIVELRATVVSRPPARRVAEAARSIGDLIGAGGAGRVTTVRYANATAVAVDDRPIFFLFAADVDALSGETVEGVAADAAATLQMAIAEAQELRDPVELVRGALLALAITVLYAAGLWGLRRIHRRVAGRLSRAAEERLAKLPGGELIVGVAHAPAMLQRLFSLVTVMAALLLTYAWLGAVLRRFPYTRAWGESLRSGLISLTTSAGGALVEQLPNLVTVLVIVVLTRVLTRLVTLAFHALEEGRVTLPGIYQETAQPTRRIVVALLWLFALIVSYKYLPGSNSEAFKGVSVFVGLVVSLGSTGIMNQLMSGLMLTYSRALRVGDFVKTADVEGTVTQLGTLSTKIKTARNEEITIPNAVIVASATTNYSRHAEREGVFVPTSVTIGYDVPWRQVHALLLLAAERTPGVRPAPKPVVLQAALGDFYVTYTLLVCPEQPQRRIAVLAALHANVQDAFNEFGVQIMSPNYEADPSAPKIVPPGRWYSAPASPAGDEGQRPAGIDRTAEHVARGA